MVWHDDERMQVEEIWFTLAAPERFPTQRAMRGSASHTGPIRALPSSRSKRAYRFPALMCFFGKTSQTYAGKQPYSR